MTDISLPQVRPGLAALLRHGLATAGPLAVSLSHFVVSLVLLRALPPHEFGAFAFILVAIQFAFGLSNALVGTPFTVRTNNGRFAPEETGLFFAANLALSFAAGLACGAIAWFTGLGLPAAALVAVFAVLTVMRWFFRSYHYAMHRPGRVAACDLAYACILLPAVALLWLTGGLGVVPVLVAFIAAALAALVGAGRECLAQQAQAADARSLGGYAEVWATQSRWTLLGVTSTEATAQAHAWLVTLIAGPAAFAPLAAAMLFFRPLGLAATSLTQLERPAMARALARGDKPLALQVMRRFRVTMLAVWCLTVAGALAVLLWHPTLLIDPAKYDIATVIVAAAFWSATSLLQVWRDPNSALLQAADRFRGLAMASVRSGTAAVAGVALLLVFATPVLSLAGVLAGQVVLAWYVSAEFRRWESGHD